MKKKNFTKFEIVCYVVAALLAIAAVYMLVENVVYMNNYVAAYGMTIMDLGSQAIQSLVAAFVPYFAYAFLVFAAGMIYRAVVSPQCECDCECDCDCDCDCDCEEQTEEAELVKVVFAETPAAVVVEE